MSCQRYSSPNIGRSYIGTNLAVVGSSPACQSLGYTRMLVADCFEIGSVPPAEYGGWCLYNDEQYVIENIPASNCPKCLVISVNPDQPYDCVNGGCVAKTTYATPGKYANLSACQAGCAKDSTCTGECVSAEQIAALQQAADQIKSRLCG